MEKHINQMKSKAQTLKLAFDVCLVSWFHPKISPNWNGTYDMVVNSKHDIGGKNLDLGSKLEIGWKKICSCLKGLKKTVHILN